MTLGKGSRVKVEFTLDLKLLQAARSADTFVETGLGNFDNSQLSSISHVCHRHVHCHRHPHPHYDKHDHYDENNHCGGNDHQIGDCYCVHIVGSIDEDSCRRMTNMTTMSKKIMSGRT